MRQLALLHFRNAITLSVKLEEALARTHARVPPAIVQMLLVLQVRGGPVEPLLTRVSGAHGHKARLRAEGCLRPGFPEAEPRTRMGSM